MVVNRNHPPHTTTSSSGANDICPNMATTKRKNDTTTAPHPKTKCSQTYTTFINTQIRSRMNSLLRKVSRHVVCYPKSYLLLMIVFSLGIFALGARSKFCMVTGTSESWTPLTSISSKHKAWIQNPSQSYYTSKDGPAISLLFHDAHGKNVATYASIKQVMEGMDRIQRLPSYQQLCTSTSTEEEQQPQPSPLCQISGVTQFWNNSLTIFQTESQNKDEYIWKTISQETFSNNNMHVHRPFFFGNYGVLYNNTIVFVQGYQVRLTLPPIVEESQRALTDRVETDIVHEIIKVNQQWKLKGSTNTMEIFTFNSFEKEVNRGIQKDIPLLPVVFFVMILFTTLIFYNSPKKQQQPLTLEVLPSRSLLGLGAVITVFFSLLTGYGIMFCIGVPFTSFAQILPFIMFGIGLDDAFVILGSYIPRVNRNYHNVYNDRNDISSDGSVDMDDKRIQFIVDNIDETMEDVGSSITLTTLTSTFAFGFGAMSSIPTVKYLCHYAWVTILIIFFYQITFFVALMTLDEKRILSNRTDNFSDTPEYTNNDHNKRPIDPEYDIDEASVVSAINNRTEEGLLHSQTHQNQIKEGVDDDVDNHENTRGAHISERIMVNYSKQLLRPPVKISVLIFFTALLVACSFSASRLEQEFNFTDVLPDDSYLTRYHEASQTYFSYLKPRVRIYFRCVDQSKTFIQEQMFNFIDDLVNDMDEIDDPPPVFWLRDFNTFRNSEEFRTYSSLNNVSTFNEQLDLFLSIPYINEAYGGDIARDPLTGNIISSRTMITMNNVDVDDANSAIAALKKQIDVTSLQPINNDDNNIGDEYKYDYGYCNNDVPGGESFFTHDESYENWEFFSVIKGELILSTLLSVAAVAIVGVLLMPHWSAICFLLPLIASLYIDLLGILNFAGIHINAVSHLAMVMSVGLMVDYIVHILLRYYECVGASLNNSLNKNKNHNIRHDCVIETLRTMGSSVFLGGLSSFLGVLPLAGSTNAIIRTIFVAFISLVSVGLLHGLVLLPVLLSIVGPVDSIHDKKHTFISPKQQRESEGERDSEFGFDSEKENQGEQAEHEQ